MSELAQKKCTACEGGVCPLDRQAQSDYLDKVADAWDVVGGHLKRTFRFKDFNDALAFTNEVGAIAEHEDHHPDIYLTYGKVTVEVWTHSVDGLTENDFIFAAKVDDAFD